ncbi:hypothetical protein [Saccharothrix algeriensis]|uniref:Uncharacterized protein n=1 Tax=Saccharothrix algeriensis TaxID=173560 RepID=A0A8T8HXB4_9PSEU|nr:hypothetical protein [Saccharothrix algeriensis]MBM7814747.1 hypothetical protein [Saccharothrix algeriensis]QTR03031.1 hypothetical protein J7S33_29275 [Saccharothrix algeriensis]
MDAATVVNQYEMPVRKHVEDNEFLAAARGGRLDERQVGRLLLLEFQTQEVEFSAYPLLSVRFRHEVPDGFFLFVADTVRQARTFLVKEVAPALGLDVDGMRRAPLSLAPRRTAELVSWLGLQAGAGQVAMAARVDFVLWTAACGALVDVLDGTDAPAELVAYLRQYAEAPPEVVDGAVEVIDYALGTGEDPERIPRSAPHMEAVLADLWHFAAAG